MGAPPPDEAPVEEALVKQAPAPGGWRRLGRGLRRGLRWLRRGLLGLLLLLVAAVGVLVGTEAGTAWAVRFGLARYAALIPGDAALGGVEGALRDGLVLRDLVLRDRAGVARLRVGALRLEWGLGSLWEGRLPVAVSVAGVVLALGPGGDASALGDLAPPPGPPPPPPPPREGPVTLPLALELAVHLQDIQVTTPDGPPLLALEQLALSATGEGAVFGAGVHRLALAAAGRRIEALRLGARWDGVEAQLAGLSVETDLGRAALAGGRFTPAELAGRLRLDAQGAAEALAPLLAERGLAALPADPTLAVWLAGGPDGFTVDLSVGLGEALDLGLQLTGAALPRPQLELSVDLRGVDPGALARVAGAEAPPGAFAGGLRARVEAPASPCALAEGCPDGPRPWALGDLARLRPADLTATLSAGCPGCSLPPVGPFSLAVDGALQDGAGQARVRLEALGVSVLVDAALDRALDPASAALQARWQITAPRVDRAARLAGVAATGALDTGGTCTGDLARLRCQGELSLRAVSAQGIRLSQADLSYTVAPLAQPLGVEADLRLAGLRAPGVPHPISARLGVRGTPAALALSLDGRHGPDRLSLALDLRPGPPLEVRLRRLRGEAQGVGVALAAPARITRSAAGVIQLTPLALELLGGRLRVAGRFDPAGRNDLKLSVADLELARLAPFVPQPALGGRLDLDTHLQGTLAAAQVDLRLALAGLRLDGHGLGDVRLTTALSPQRLAVSLGLTQGPERAVGVALDLPVVANLARGALRPRLDASGSADLRLRGLTPAWLGPLAPLPPDLDFALEGEARVAGRPGRWASTTDLRGRVAAAGLDAIPFQLALAAEPGAQRLTLEAAVTPPGGSQPLPLQLSAEAAVDLEALARGAPLDRSAPLSGRLVVPPIPLASLAGLLPASLHGPEGRLALELRVAGSLADPMPVGRVDLEGGAVTVLALGQRLTGVTAGLAIDGRRITLERLDFKAAEGRGSLTGGGGLAADGALDGALALRLKRFPVLAPGAPPLRIDSRIDVTLAQPPGGVLGVVATVKGTDVELLKLAGGGPRAIPDHPRITWASDPPPAPAAGEAPPATPIEISVRIPEPLRIFGRILDMSWIGRLDLRLGPDPQMSGALSAQGGFVELLSNRFELTEGEITLAPGATPTPFMRIEARTETAEGVVTAKIRGSAGAPSLSFSSEPPLEESEILTLLVTGSSTAGEEEEGDVRAEAAALLASFQAPAFEAALQEQLGVDRVRLSFGEGGLETPILSFGKHVTRRLYVEARYRPNPTPHENETELSARLRLRQRWTLESRYGDLGLGDLGVFWDVPLPRDRPAE